MPKIIGSETKDQDRLIDGQIMNERTLRYRRNVLALSFIILVLSLSPELDFSSLSIFGISFKANAAVTKATVWSFLTALYLYQVLSFNFEAYYDWRGWAHKVRAEITKGYLSFLFFQWPSEKIWEPPKKHLVDEDDSMHQWDSVVEDYHSDFPGRILFVRGWRLVPGRRESQHHETIYQFHNASQESFTLNKSILIRTRSRVLFFASWEFGFPLVIAALAAVKLPWQHAWDLIRRIVT